MKEKKQEPEFVVTDRRKFTEAGDVRESDTQTTEEAAPGNQPPAASHQAPPASTDVAGHARIEHQREAPPITEAEHQAQNLEYQEGNKRLDDVLREKTGGKAQSIEMTFERLVASLYMTAMLQMGLMAPEGEQPRADILGARQTIDTLGILSERTKGNLTPVEQNLLQQSLFDLRMAFLELTNAITRPPDADTKGGPGFGSIPGAKK